MVILINNKINNIKIEDLIPFTFHSGQTYQDKRLEQLMDSIKRLGLMNPIIVRSTNGGKYEIICGHNRVKAMKELGYNEIPSDVREGLSDNEAIELFYDSNLNQQSFSDWNYTEKIKAIKYTETLIRMYSQQGKRNDLNKKNENKSESITSVQDRQKSTKDFKRSTTRDRMARRLGIATATLSKYRSITKLSDNFIDSISQMLDQKKITFEFAYRISKLKEIEIEWILNYICKSSGKKIDINNLKNLCNISKNNINEPLSNEDIEEILFPNVFQPRHRID